MALITVGLHQEQNGPENTPIRNQHFCFVEIRACTDLEISSKSVIILLSGIIHYGETQGVIAMISDQVKSIFEEFSNQDDIFFLDGATEEQINEFERNNNIKLPQQYKEWLLLSDGGEFFLPAGIQLYGVAHKPAIDVNENDRPSNEYTVIGALATGDPILIKKESEQIVIYNHEAGKIEDDESYPNFVAFINDLSETLGIGVDSQ